MPEAEIRRRGGAVRYRRLCIKKDPAGRCIEWRNVAVVPKAGPRGGHTISGPEHHAK